MAIHQEQRYMNENVSYRDLIIPLSNIENERLKATKYLELIMCQILKNFVLKININLL